MVHAESNAERDRKVGILDLMKVTSLRVDMFPFSCVAGKMDVWRLNIVVYKLFFVLHTKRGIMRLD